MNNNRGLDLRTVRRPSHQLAGGQYIAKGGGPLSLSGFIRPRRVGTKLTKNPIVVVSGLRHLGCMLAD